MSELRNQRASAVENLASTIAEAAELGEALRYLGDDPASSLTKSRVILERILRSILRFEQQPIPEKATVGQLLRQIRQRIPERIYAAMEYVNRVASAEGAHAGQAHQRTAVRALDHICDVLEWYASEYLTSGLTDNFGDVIVHPGALLIYVSTGGTCRCAMANVITRQVLETGAVPRRIRPMSAALHQPTRPTISKEAVQVIREELGVDASAHRTVRLDERYVRRADLILAMDSKLLEQLPEAAGPKAHLFAEFFGGTGNIEDPWSRGLDAYRARFSEIRQLVSQGSDNLVSWLTSHRT